MRILSYLLKQFLFGLSVIILYSHTALALNILIDPGHGGIDSGAVHNNIVESQLALTFAKELQQVIESKRQHSAFLLRVKNETIPIKQRALLIQKTPADLVISLHANANRDHRINGAEIYFLNSLPPDEESRHLAKIENQFQSEAPTSTKDTSDLQAIITDLKRESHMRLSEKLALNIKNNWKSLYQNVRIRQAPFYVLNESQKPSLLIEFGYLTHFDDAKKLQSKEFRSQMAQKIYEAIDLYSEKYSRQNKLSSLN